jgi:hypothetical protein
MPFYPPLPQSGLFMATEEKGRDLADHGNLTFSKKGQIFLLLKKRGYFSSLPIKYCTHLIREKRGKCIRDIQNHLLSISLIVIKYKIIHYTEVPRININ